MSDRLEEAKRLAQIHYESGSTSQVYIATSSTGGQENPEDPIKLIEVNDDTLPSGIVPLQFGPLPNLGITHVSTIIEVTGEEFQQIESGELQLPPGWENRTPIHPPATASTDE